MMKSCKVLKFIKDSFQKKISKWEKINIEYKFEKKILFQSFLSFNVKSNRDFLLRSNIFILMVDIVRDKRLMKSELKKIGENFE